MAFKLLASASGDRLVGPMSSVQWVNASSFTTGIAWSVLALNPVGGAMASEAELSEQADSEIEQVVVTGSRIPIEIGRGTAPVTILELDDIRRGGLDTLGRVLQTLPFNTGSPTNTNSNFGNGSERIDLRGLGPKRTLILLNGRRFPNGGLGGDASVDASMVPLSLVDRVEVLTSGATAIYGADAVAGVVNVITREATSGLEIDLKNSLTERGDGSIFSGQAVAGIAIGRGTWSLGFDYLKQDPVQMSERGYSAYPMTIVSADGTRVRTGTRTTPDGAFGVPDGNVLGLAPELYVRIPGSTGQTAANYRLRQPSDVFVLAPYSYLQTPNEHGTVWLLGTQPINDNLKFFAEGLWHDRRSEQQNAPAPIIGGIFSPVHTASPLPTLSDGRPGIPADNWYNPFGVDIVDIGRRLVELPDRKHQQHIEAWRALIGVGGTWQRWNWELALATSESRSLSSVAGVPSALRLIPALGPSGPDDSGNIVCGARDPATGIVPAANVVAGCIPLDLFGGAGSITSEQIDYINVSLYDHGSGTSEAADFSAEGPWGELPAGPLRWAFGAEYRDEGGSFHLDPLRKAGVTGEETPLDLQGVSFDSRSVYLEGRAPLLKDRRAARALDLSVGVRYSEFSSFGGDTTWQSSLRWQPVESWSLRANYAEVFRAPALDELYETQIPHRVLDTYDPCGNDPTPEQQVNCAANGVPGGVYQQDPSVEVDFVTGGNPDLLPESGRSVDVGLELTPASLPGLRVTIDYFNVDLGRFIETPGLGDILFECADRGTPSACDLVHRANDGTLLQVDGLRRNLGRLVANGYDFSADYGFHAGRVTFDTGVLATYLETRDSEFVRGLPPVHLAGERSFPHWRGLGHIDASWAGWRIGYSMQYIGAQDQFNYDVGANFPIHSVLYHDLEGSLALSSGVQFRAGVLNLTDKDPPYVQGGGPNTDVAGYRLLGRTYYAALHYEF